MLFDLSITGVVRNAVRIAATAHEAGLATEIWVVQDRGPTRVDVPDGVPIVSFGKDIGDMLQRLTNGRLRSTSHRVVNPEPDRASHARYSMPFFLHFRSDFLIEPLPGTVPAGEQPKWPPITADEYLQERLRDIKLV